MATNRNAREEIQAKAWTPNSVQNMDRPRLPPSPPRAARPATHNFFQLYSDENDETASTAEISPTDENATVLPANGGTRGGISSGASGDNAEGEEGVRENRESEKPGTSDYFQRAHSKIETVRQPTALKGGVLKEYQLQGLQWMVSCWGISRDNVMCAFGTFCHGASFVRFCSCVYICRAWQRW